MSLLQKFKLNEKLLIIFSLKGNIINEICNSYIFVKKGVNITCFKFINHE